MLVSSEQRLAVLLLIWVLGLRICLGHGEESGSCPFSRPEPHQHHHHEHHMGLSESKLAEELAEEEDLKLYGFGSHHGHHDHHHDHDHDDNHHHGHDHLDSELSNLGLWIQAMGCSLLVSLASLVCLIILPVIFLQGKPSKVVVDSLAAFGAGAMLGDAFLHQLPHAFGGEHSHSHDHHVDHTHDHFHHLGHVDSHSHSLKDLSVGLSILSGIVLFLLVEKVVRYVEAYSGNGVKAWGHGHHHHHHKNSKKSDDIDVHDSHTLQSVDEKDGNVTEKLSNEKVLDGVSDNNSNEENYAQHESLLRKRTTTTVASDDGKPGFDAANGSANKLTPSTEKGLTSSPSNLVFGYLNLFSDGVHNFTDGMALGSAFLLNGTIGGWSRTLFLLAHELPQEVGDFGILVRSGFSVSKALFFNFLSALVALAGTALALLIGRDPGQSSLIEGFTAGGFIYIAVAGVLPEMNSGNSTFKSSAIQLTSLIMGMAVALCISLVE
ncbi:IAA-alanine resistance protein 1 isoform X2 [Telopea speciosissima]|uniref:IAA-alanine resistance protein 1 isoform X2 n=1 Tax=Telopea speciosissima TaxID=54955 RepID=UPI001CC3F31C|nr:IAA-alanine resistance protein 1 isoform X2 [Telopea speciosissima]